MDPVRYPSAVEFAGSYNLSAEDAPEDTAALRTVEDLPPLSFDEIWEFRTEAVEWFAQSVPSRTDPLEEELFVRDGTRDRTLYVDVPDFGVLNSEMLHRLQVELLEKRSAWRVALVGESEATSILVYPQAIRVGREPITADVDAAIRGVNQELQQAREVRLGPRRRKLAHLKKLLPTLVRAIGTKPFQVAGVFDRSGSDHSRLGIYLFFPGNDSQAFYVRGPGGREQIWVGSAFAIDSQGTIISEIKIPNSTSYCLVPWLPPHGFQGTVKIIARATGEETPYEVKTADIIRDDDLKVHFAS
jgi:hypothetical protein